MLGSWASEIGTTIDEPLQAGEGWYERRKDVKTNPGPRRRKDPCQESRKLESRRTKEKDYWKGEKNIVELVSRLEVSWLRKKK